MIQNLRFRDAALAKRVTERIMDDLIHIAEDKTGKSKRPRRPLTSLKRRSAI
jgi:hypothetical protein